MILVNFKIYKETFGDGALKLAEVCKRIAQKTGVPIIPIVSALDAYRIKKELGIKVYLQHIDDYQEGQKTGFISPIQAQSLGIDGGLINHSEHRLSPGTIKSILKNTPSDFETVVCVSTLGQAEKWAKNIKPTMIAYEVKSLIGSKDKSIATENPSEIEKMVKLFSPTPVLAGAGIKDINDIQISLKLGCKGVLISSAVVKAADPEKVLVKLAESFSV